MEITGKNLIGKRISGDSEKSFYAENPATGEKPDLHSMRLLLVK